MRFDKAGSTIMSVLQGVADQGDNDRKIYLERFAKQYTQPLVEFLCKAKLQSEEDACDLVQSFWIAKLLEPTSHSNIVAKYMLAKEAHAPERVLSFRRYLLRAISNYFVDAARKLSKTATIGLEGVEGFEPAIAKDIDTFDTVWSNCLLRSVISNVAQECQQNCQHDMWVLFLRQIIVPRVRNCPPPGYAELASEMGFRDARSASNAVRTVIRKFQNHMKQCICDYLPVNSLATSEASINQEFDEILSILSRPGGLDVSILDDLLTELPESCWVDRSTLNPFSTVGINQKFAFLTAPESTLYATATDLQCRWQQLRETRIVEWLQTYSVVKTSESDATFNSLARCEYLSEDCIVAIRNVAKQTAREPDDEPVLILGLIYLLAIVDGYQHHRRLFSSDNSMKIKHRISQVVNLPWLDQHSQQTLRSFLSAHVED